VRSYSIFLNKYFVESQSNICKKGILFYCRRVTSEFVFSSRNTGPTNHIEFYTFLNEVENICVERVLLTLFDFLYVQNPI
jgi:hypothetical protein